MINKPEEPATPDDPYLGLSDEDGATAEESMKGYVRIVWKISNRLRAEYKLEELLLRTQWEKRNGSKRTSQNMDEDDDGT